MSKRTLSPAILAALGLSACVDGCGPEELPLIGRLFQNDGPEDAVTPCLSPPLDTGPPPVAPGVPPMHPCLKVALPPQPPVGPCLSPPVTPPPPVRVGPCLRIAPKQKPVVSPIPVGPCLELVPEPIQQKCLSHIEVPDIPELGDQGSAPPSPKADVLAALVVGGVLPSDVLARIHEGDQ